MSFTDEKPFIVSQERYDAFKRVRGVSRFGCSLCGHIFSVGDKARWLCGNAYKLHCGNFFVCPDCDGPNDEVLKRANESYLLAAKLAKQWSIYGPDWQH